MLFLPVSEKICGEQLWTPIYKARKPGNNVNWADPFAQ